MTGIHDEDSTFLFADSGAPVAVPITWNELKATENAKPFGIADANKLIGRSASKSLAGWGFAVQSLPDI